MKKLLLASALLAPTLGAAYPNPNVSASISTGDLVNTIWTQPVPAPLVLADTSLLPSDTK